MSTSCLSDDRTDISMIIDQLAYHAEELIAFRESLSLLPPKLIESEVEGVSISIKRMVLDGLQVERARIKSHAIDLPEISETITEVSCEGLLHQWAAARNALVEWARGLDMSAWYKNEGEATLSEKLRQYVVDDTDRLRAIGERILGSGWGIRS